MTTEEFIRVVKSLGHYDGHTWIDFEIMPGIVCSLLEEFTEIGREEALVALAAEGLDCWNERYAEKVRKYFGPRFFVVKGNGARRRYWSINREWKDSFSNATRFDSDDQARKTFARECGTSPGHDEVLAVAYPEWTSCENLP